MYSSDAPNLETDVHCAVTRALVGHYVLHDGEPAPDADVAGPWYSLDHHFVLDAGDNAWPRPPITAKAEGERPQLTVLERRS